MSAKRSKTKGQGEEEKELVCIFLGFEIYTTEKAATVLKSNIKDLLLGQKDVLAVKERPPVNMTPTISSAVKRAKGLFSKKKKD